MSVGPTQDLLQAVIALCLADSVLSAASPAGPSLTRADETRTVPYIVIGVTRGGKIKRYMEGDSVQSFAVSFSVVAESATQAAMLTDRIEAVFDGKSFACSVGQCIYSLLTGAAAVRQVKHLSGGQPLYETQVSSAMQYFYHPVS